CALPIWRIDEEKTIQPMYSVKGDLTQKRLKKIIQQVIVTNLPFVVETLPSRYTDAYKLPDIHSAIKTMHYPKSKTALKHAKRRIIYEEFLLFQLKMQLLRKMKSEANKGNQINYDTNINQTIIIH